MSNLSSFVSVSEIFPADFDALDRFSPNRESLAESEYELGVERGEAWIDRHDLLEISK